MHGLPSDGEPGCCERLSFVAGGDVGAGHSRRRISRVGPTVDPDGRPTKCHLQRQNLPDFESQGLLAVGGPAVGDNSTGIYKRIGYYNLQEAGAHFGKGLSFARWRRRFDPSWRRPTKAKGKRKGKAKESRSGGGGCLAPDDAMDFLSAEIEFTTWAICLPRHVLAAKNRFSWFLSTTFSVSRRGSPSHTAVFPLPIPYVGLFYGSGPGLSKKRMKALAHRRLLHVVCMASTFFMEVEPFPLMRFGGLLAVVPARRLFLWHLDVVDQNWLLACLGSRHSSRVIQILVITMHGEEMVQMSRLRCPRRLLRSILNFSPTAPWTQAGWSWRELEIGLLKNTWMGLFGFRTWSQLSCFMENLSNIAQSQLSTLKMRRSIGNLP